ncbi:PfkB family carbohydrate kinase [Primorskyibacter sp. S187A]|uniref:PfkB family carbohydrate kinase n=1 Tax=Primorskyibacter sp. S187A TaxID=3415130 RepID=UPI003C7C112B
MTNVLCIGSVLWDVIGRTANHVGMGSDVPGRITQIPGGVAFNIAMTLHRFGLTPALITSIGRDKEGEALIAECNEMGLITDYIYRSDDLATDRYMAIEGAGGLVAAIADAHSLETAGEKILRPVLDGTLSATGKPFGGLIALDGNLTEALLARIASDPAFAAADLRVAPASPGKAQRLAPFLSTPSATLYVNLEEAGILCQDTFETAHDAARALVKRGALRALVTNGGAMAADATSEAVLEAHPPEVLVTRVTGAGDTFMAAHMAYEYRGLDRQSALGDALTAAARYVAGDTPQ